MYQKLSVFQTAAAMAKHAGARQAVVAQNVANADTPGYRARTIPPFMQVFDQTGSAGMRTSRAGHIGVAPAGSSKLQSVISNAEPSPNGNSVSIEEEMLKSVAVSREHSKSLAIYRHAMTVLRTSLGR
ncbi:MAG: flagellar basal-body rod protein FlgB [Gammaproteobacteria bacterium]|jgi:flagellar basal-body rod protein FlgB